MAEGFIYAPKQPSMFLGKRTNLSLSSGNNEDQVSDMVLYLMSHDPADVVQRQGPLLRMSQRHSS
jgi:hypothetical protein